MNDNLLKIDSLLSPYIKTASWSTPPADASNGDMYIVAAGGAGDWVGADGSVAVMVSEKWVFYKPMRGLRCYLESTARFIWFNGTSWVNESDGSSAENPNTGSKPKKYHVSLTVPYQPASEELLLLLPIAMPIQIKKDAPESRITLLNESPGYVSIDIKRNGIKVGVVTIEKGKYDGSLSFYDSVTFAPGDRLEMFAPRDPVDGFSGFGMVMVFDVLGG